MNPWLAEMYGTAGAGVQSTGDEGTEKQAQLELFAKLASDEGIDLTSMTPEQVNDLYSTIFSKTAEEGEEKEEDEEKEEEAAKAEHEEKKEAAAKLAEAELMGQVMAHSFVRELGEIEKSAAMPAALSKGLEAAGKKGKELAGGAATFGRRVTGSTLKPGSKGEPAALSAARKALAHGQSPETAMRVGRHYGAERSAVGKARKHLAIGAGGAATGIGGAAALASRKKEASAFDTIAARNAIKLASAAGYDEGEAATLIESVYNLGLEDSEKVAFIADTSDAIHVRSLEYLEKAGYPVNWEEVFGS